MSPVTEDVTRDMAKHTTSSGYLPTGGPRKRRPQLHTARLPRKKRPCHGKPPPSGKRASLSPPLCNELSTPTGGPKTAAAAAEQGGHQPGKGGAKTGVWHTRNFILNASVHSLVTTNCSSVMSLSPTPKKDTRRPANGAYVAVRVNAKNTA